MALVHKEGPLDRHTASKPLIRQFGIVQTLCWKVCHIGVVWSVGASKDGGPLSESQFHKLLNLSETQVLICVMWD